MSTNYYFKLKEVPKINEFIENNYSPIYHSLLMEKYVEMSIRERQEFLNNNYNYIIIKEENIPEYKKKFDIYNLGIGTTAKFVKPVINKQMLSINVDENVEYKEVDYVKANTKSIDNNQKTLSQPNWF